MSLGRMRASTRSSSSLGTISMMTLPGSSTPPMVRCAICLTVPDVGARTSRRATRSAIERRISAVVASSEPRWASSTDASRR
jgi:predicted component of type VI protein secretion system